MTDTFDPPVIADVTDTEDYIETPLTQEIELVVKTAWVKFDDLFDSIDGGPHLKDRSKNNFNIAKSALLVPYALNRINYGNPPLGFTHVDFPFETDSAVLAQSLVIEIILHLMRSYTEQPTPTGSGYARLARQDYLQRWQAVLESEMKLYEDMVRFFRRKYLNLGHTAGLIDFRRGQGWDGNYRGRQRARGWRF